MIDPIEQVALAIEGEMFAPHELPLSEELHQKYRLTAKAAIDAFMMMPDNPFAQHTRADEYRQAALEYIACLHDPLSDSAAWESFERARQKARHVLAHNTTKSEP